VLTGQRHLDDLLAGAEAVENGATREALLAKRGVNIAAQVRAQVRAWSPGGLVDGEVGGLGENWCHAAQTLAAGAVSTQFLPPVGR
jgi:hypothetical protein